MKETDYADSEHGHALEIPHDPSAGNYERDEVKQQLVDQTEQGTS